MDPWDDPAAVIRRQQSHREFARQRAGLHHQDVTVEVSAGATRRLRAVQQDGRWVISEDTIVAGEPGGPVNQAVLTFDLDAARTLNDALRGVIAFIDGQSDT